jgi:F-box-like
MLTTPSSPALSLTTNNKRKSRAKKKFDLLGLPNEILLKILDNLDVFDSATLALTCKRFAGVATSYSQLDWPPDALRSYARPYEEGHFLKERLGDKYFSKRSRYCRSCKHYVPRRRSYWQRKLGRKGWEGRWRSLKMWDFKEWWGLTKTQEMLTQWDKGNALHCPRCKLCKALLISNV